MAQKEVQDVAALSCDSFTILLPFEACTYTKSQLRLQRPDLIRQPRFLRDQQLTLVRCGYCCQGINWTRILRYAV